MPPETPDQRRPPIAARSAPSFRSDAYVLFSPALLGWLDRDFHLRVRPATLKSAASVAGPIIGLRAQHVFSRFAKRRRGGRLALERGLRRRLKIRGLDRGLVVGKGDRTRPAELAPRNRDCWGLLRRRPWNNAGVIG